MSKNFVPSFHFEHPSKKMTSEWAMSAINFYFYNTANKSLLDGKDVKEIDDYAKGDFDMKPFKKMFKSIKRNLQRAQSANHPNYKGDVDDGTGLDWTPLPLIPTKLNAAISMVQKIPLEISCKATDPLALEKKKKDFEFLKNKKKLEEDLLPLAEEMGIENVNLGTTEHGSVPYSDSPYGLDLNDPEDADIFSNLIYSLGVEAAFETVLQRFADVKGIPMEKLMEIRDQFRYGVSVNRAYRSAITGLPDGSYQHPSPVFTPHSELPDYSDNTHRYIQDKVTVLELFNFFGNEIKDEKELDKIINGGKGSYTYNNHLSYQEPKNWSTFKLNLLYFEVKTLDWIGIHKKRKSGFSSFTMDETNASEKLWGQNTYGFWWLQNTDYCFGIHKLSYAQREKGKEVYQGFSTNIYRSQEKSCVEMAIGENKKAQIADIKLQHAIIKSLPSGKYIDLRFLRGALSGLKDETNQWTMEDLINLAFETNVIVGDTADFDSTPAMEAIARANANIAAFTGINEQLTGQSANPEGLIGMQKLLINSSINALYYCNEAIAIQYQKRFNIWGNIIKQAVEEGGKARQAIVNMVGLKKTAIIDNLDQLPLHDIGIVVRVSQREEERAKFTRRIEQLKMAGIIDTASEYMLDALENPKDKMAFLAVKEKLYRKRLDKERAEQFEQEQNMLAQQGENTKQAIVTEAEMEQQLEFSRGEVKAKLMQLGHELGMSAKQMDGFVKRILQQDRGKMAIDKSLKTLEAKNNINNQQALTA
jgi:hypothetical protein